MNMQKTFNVYINKNESFVSNLNLFNFYPHRCNVNELQQLRIVPSFGLTHLIIPNYKVDTKSLICIVANIHCIDQVAAVKES